MNKHVSLKSFLTKYIKHLSNKNTVNVKQLCSLAEDNERLEMPIVLYCHTLNKSHLIDKYGSTPMKAMSNSLEKGINQFKTLEELYKNDNATHEDFYRIYRTYLSKKIQFENTIDQREKMMNLFEKSIDENIVSKYELCKVANVKMQNFNKALKEKDYTKVSYEKCCIMMDYVLSKS